MPNCVQFLCTFSQKLVHHGVSQGSILGPVFFIIYINDLKNVIHNVNSEICVFQVANDSSYLSNNCDMSNLIYFIDVIFDYFYANSLALNKSKSQYICFNLTKNKNETYNKSVYFLGLELDPKLNWQHHIGGLCKNS